MADKLQLAPNQWATLKKKYNEPFIGKSQHGEYYTYTFDMKGKQIKFFANEKKMWCIETAKIAIDEEFKVCDQQKAGEMKKTFWLKVRELTLSSDNYNKAEAVTYRNNIIEATANRLKDFDRSQFDQLNPNGTVATQNNINAPQKSNVSTKGSGNGQMTKGDWELKEMRITKLAIIKSLIEAGYKPDDNSIKALEFWFKVWQKETTEERQKDMEAFSQSKEPDIPEPQGEEEKEIKVEYMPF